MSPDPCSFFASWTVKWVSGNCLPRGEGIWLTAVPGKINGGERKSGTASGLAALVRKRAVLHKQSGIYLRISFPGSSGTEHNGAAKCTKANVRFVTLVGAGTVLP